MHKKMPCFILQDKTFDQSNSPREWAEGLWDPLDGNNSTMEQLHKFPCQNVLATLHLEYVNCPIWLIKYVQRIP